jgi:hypothetical protein
VLIFALVAAAGIGRFIARWKARLPWLDAAAGLLVLGLALDIGLVAQKPMANAMWMVPPDNIPQGRPFHFEQEPPFQYKRHDWAGPMYLAMLGNTGVMNCYGTPPFERRGARPVTARDYHGEAWLAGGKGSAKIAEWSPNRVVVEVEGADPGELVVWNMNFDEGWRADTGPVVSHENTLATPAPAAKARITFQYRPPGLGAGLLVGALAVGWLVFLRRRERAGAI